MITELLQQIEDAGSHVASMNHIADYTNWEVRLAKLDPRNGWSSQLVYGASLEEALTTALSIAKPVEPVVSESSEPITTE